MSITSLVTKSRTSFLYRSRRGSFKTGCLIATGIFLLLIIGAVIWISVSWRGWLGTFTRDATTKVVNQTQLPQDQKTKVISKVDEVTKDFEDGKISMQQMGQIIQELSESPLLPLAVVYGLEEGHINKSGLPKEEKEAGVLALNRAARGIVEKSISTQSIRDIMAPVTVPSANPNQIQMKQKITDEDLRLLFKNAKTRADEAKIPNEPYKVNVGDELAKAIDIALGRIPKPAPASNGSPAPTAPPAPTPPAAPPADKK